VNTPQVETIMTDFSSPTTDRFAFPCSGYHSYIHWCRGSDNHIDASESGSPTPIDVVGVVVVSFRCVGFIDLLSWQELRCNASSPRCGGLFYTKTQTSADFGVKTFKRWLEQNSLQNTSGTPTV